jgi:hypothetical protein
MVSFDVDTAAPDEALDLPLAAIELIAWLRAESAAMLAALVAVVPAAPPVVALAVAVAVVAVAAFDVTVPAGALVVCAPLALPPDVLMKSCLSISGLCQYCGATSITT